EQPVVGGKLQRTPRIVQPHGAFQCQSRILKQTRRFAWNFQAVQTGSKLDEAFVPFHLSVELPELSSAGSVQRLDQQMPIRAGPGKRTLYTTAQINLLPAQAGGRRHLGRSERIVQIGNAVL